MSQDKEAQFDRLLTFYENVILGMREREIASEADPDIDDTASFIASRLASRRTLPVLAAAPPRRSRPRSRVSVPRDATGRRRLLGRLIATRSNLPDRISMAFTAREPDDEEIADMLDEILREVDGSGGD